MGNISGSNVQVYPSTRRASADNTLYREARLLSEGSVIDASNKVLDVVSYVVNDSGVIALDSPISFVIFGYHFTINEVRNIIDSFSGNINDGDDIYAHIQISTAGGIKELVGQDEGNVYTGVSFSTNETEPNGSETVVVESLKILHRFGDRYYVPEDSVSKYDIMRMTGTLDCGEIS